MKQLWTGVGGLFALTAVMLGAFGAHGLSGKITPEHLEVFKTGAYYQMVHALALILTGMRMERRPGSTRLGMAAAWLFVVGMAVFSGSLYALAVTGTRAWGIVTPIGGLAFMAGWAVFVLAEIGGHKIDR